MADDLEEIGRFLDATGLDAAGLARAAADPGMLAAVLDHCLQDDARVIACAAALGLRPEAIAEARRALPGGELPHWT